jgi:hypothetical protein
MNLWIGFFKKLLSVITDAFSHDAMNIGIAKWNQILILLLRNVVPKFHISKIILGYLYFNAKLSADHGKYI